EIGDWLRVNARVRYNASHGSGGKRGRGVTRARISMRAHPGVGFMTSQQIVEEARIPGAQSILVLGSFEKRVTVYAQQVRALNLVDALLSEGLVRPHGGKIAILGGGA